MARVNVEQKALAPGTDPRFTVLGRAVEGSPEARDHAWGLWLAMIVWNHCQETGKYTVKQAFLEALRPGLSNAILEAELGVLTRHGIRIRGTKGRVEWLEKRRKDGKKGGRPGSKKCKTLGFDKKHPGNNPPAPAPAPAPTVSEKTIGDLRSPHPAGGGGRAEARRLRSAEWGQLFPTWWADVWNKVGKQAAIKAWAQVGSRHLAKTSPSDLLQNVRVMQDHFEKRVWPKQDTPPHPATWLRAQAFDDASVLEVIDNG